MFNIQANFALANTDSKSKELITKGSGFSKRVTASAAAKKNNFTVEAADGGGTPGGGYSTGQTATSKNTTLLWLEGILQDDIRVRRRIYRDIYRHDPIAGGAVDLLSTLPFSDFHLIGIKDRDVLDTFHKCLECLRLKSLLPAISRDYLVKGNFVGSANFDEQQKIFTSLMPVDIDHCQITEIPMFGHDPIIDVTLPKELIKILNRKNDPRINRIVARLPTLIREGLKTGVMPLEPSNTLFLARRTLTTDTIGTSYYERILPIHLLEKILFKGTIDAAHRRQRSILHVTAGGDDEWIATMNDLETLKSMFLEADMDPTGAVIVTRTGINTNEIRSANDFWNVSENDGFAASTKYRALGVNEEILQGGGSLSTLDASLSIMVDGIKSYREYLDTNLFYDKLFPSLSSANGFENTRRNKQVMGKNLESISYGGRSSIIQGNEFLYALCADTRHPFNIKDEDINTDNLLIPRIVWHKHLAPEGDSAYLQMLTELNQAGIPIPLATLAAAGGISLDKVLDGMDEDIQNRKRIAQFQEKISEFSEQGQQADPQQVQSALMAAVSKPGIKQVGLMNRDFSDERNHFHNTDKQGRFKNTSKRERNRMAEQATKRLSSVLANIAAKDNDKIRKTKVDKPMLHMKLGIIK